MISKDFEAVTGGRDIRSLRGDFWSPSRGLFVMTSSRLDFGKAFGIRAGGSFRGFTRGRVKRAVAEEMAMCMEFTASERYMFIINRLHPFKVIVKKTY